MTIRDRDVIKEIDGYLNPDPVDLIDSYLEKSVQVKPNLMLSEGGDTRVPSSFFDEFDALTKSDMRSTLFEESFLMEDLDLEKAPPKLITRFADAVAGLGARAGGRTGRIQDAGDTKAFKISQAASRAKDATGRAKDATGKAWGTVKNNAWFAPWSAAWRGKVGEGIRESTAEIGRGVREGKQAFQEQRRLERKAGGQIRSKLAQTNERAYSAARGKLATRYANAHSDAAKKLKDQKSGAKMRKDTGLGAMNDLSDALGYDANTGEETHTLKEKDQRLGAIFEANVSSKTGERSKKAQAKFDRGDLSTTAEKAAEHGQKIQHTWGEDKKKDRALANTMKEVYGKSWVKPADGRVEVAMNEDTYGELIDSAAGSRRNELLAKRESHLKDKKNENLTNDELNELHKINEGMNIRESAEAIGTDLDMVEYHVNQIERAQHSALRAMDPRLNSVIPPAEGWPDEFGGEDARSKAQSNWDTNMEPSIAAREEAGALKDRSGSPKLDDDGNLQFKDDYGNIGPKMGLEDSMITAHIDHMRGNEFSSPSAKTESQFAQSAREGTGVAGLTGQQATRSGGIAPQDREYLKPGQSAPKWGGEQVQEITTDRGTRYYSKKQSRSLRERAQESKQRSDDTRKESEAESAELEEKKSQQKQERKEKWEGRKAKAKEVGKKVGEAVKKPLKGRSSVQTTGVSREESEKEEASALSQAVKDAEKEVKQKEDEAKKAVEAAEKATQEAAKQAEDQRKEVERRAAEREEEQKRFDNLSPEEKEEELLGAINQVLEDAKGPEQGKMWQFMNRLLGGEGKQTVQKALDAFITVRKSKDAGSASVEMAFFVDVFVSGMDYGLSVDDAANFAKDMVSKSNDQLDDYLDRVSISGDLFVKSNLESYRTDPIDELQGMIDALVLLDAVNKVESK